MNRKAEAASMLARFNLSPHTSNEKEIKQMFNYSTNTKIFSIYMAAALRRGFNSSSNRNWFDLGRWYAII